MSADPPEPLKNLGLTLLAAFFTAFLGSILYLVSSGAIAAFRVAHGQAGEPGTATIERVNYRGHGGQHCSGTFTPDDGGPEVEAFIETEPCEPGRTLDARLTENKTPLIGEHMTPTAWEEGSRQWIVWMIALIPAAIVLSPLILVCALGTVMLSFATLADLARIVFGSH